MIRKAKLPLDKLLTEKKLAPDLKSARALIMAGRVVVDDKRADKAGSLFSSKSNIRIKKSFSGEFAGRGGIKLATPLDLFKIDVAGKTVIDVGASTGGFTDCLLQRGASMVFAVDVGYGQLAWKLRIDKRVTVLDRTNIKALKTCDLNPVPQFAVIDASFISLKNIFSHTLSLISDKGELLALLKPQFEAGRAEVEKGGIVKDEMIYQRLMQEIVALCFELGLMVCGITESPVKGRKGNREFFIYLKKQ